MKNALILFLCVFLFSTQVRAELKVSPTTVDTSILGTKKLNLAKPIFDYDRDSCQDSGIAIADVFSDGSCMAQAPLLLPSGSIIQSITVTLAASDGESINVLVRSVDLNDGSTIITHGLLRVSGETNGIKKKTVDLGTDTITMDANTAYLIEVTMEDNDDMSDDYPRIYGASVTYK